MMALSLNQFQAEAVMNHQGMTKEEKAYFKTLGARIAQRRKALDLKQVEVADALGIAQQTYASYEVGRHRIPVSLLPRLVEVLQTDANVLLGITIAPLKRGPVPKFQRQIDQISRLPKSRQRFVVQMLETALAQG